MTMLRPELEYCSWDGEPCLWAPGEAWIIREGANGWSRTCSMEVGINARGTRTLNAMGYYDDFCVKFDGRWLIKEKRIYRCNDETPLPW